jgi:monofunctional biosynthetic peptidoglycan transglycosylase
MAVVVLAGATYYQWATWPDVAAVVVANPKSTAFIDDNIAKGGSASVAWAWVPLDRISPHLKRAVLVAEDINFFSHNGFETHEIGQAIRVALSRKELPRGASTITQQVAKNLWLSPSRNPWRKFKEAVLTAQLEQKASKLRILEIYLNIAQMGPNLFGAEAAARAYFDTGAAHLTASQGAQLAATLSRPSIWNPDKPTPGYEQRVALITQRAQKAEWLDSRF